MSEKEESWEKYFFPEIEFLPSYIPFAGLCEALWERSRVQELKQNMETPDSKKDEKNPYLPELLSAVNGRSAAIAFDSNLRPVIGQYLNHTKIKTTEELADIPFWTFESLLDELDETAIDPLETMFVPEFYVEWALQRYRMINLLKFAQIDYQCSYLSGSEHTGIPTSPSAAINAALKNAKPGDPAVNGSLSRTTTTIWGPDHGWDYGTYCADVYQCGDVSARLPDELKNAETMLFISVDAPGGAADHFDSYGTGILQGINSFTADEEGKFTSGWTLPATPDKVWTPVEGKTETFGFQALKIFCCADFTGIFKFKEDDAQR